MVLLVDALGSHVPHSALVSAGLVVLRVVVVVVVTVRLVEPLGSQLPQCSGQAVADGPHEVTVTSLVAVTVRVSAETAATRPATARTYFILLFCYFDFDERGKSG